MTKRISKEDMQKGPEWERFNTYSVAFWLREIEDNILLVNEDVEADFYEVQNGFLTFFRYDSLENKVPVATFKDWTYVKQIEISPKEVEQ